MTPAQLHEDFTRNRKYGSLEFEYRAGELVFVRRKETLIPASAHENDSTAVPRGEHGTNNRVGNKAI